MIGGTSFPPYTKNTRPLDCVDKVIATIMSGILIFLLCFMVYLIYFSGFRALSPDRKHTVTWTVCAGVFFKNSTIRFE